MTVKIAAMLNLKIYILHVFQFYQFFDIFTP